MTSSELLDQLIGILCAERGEAVPEMSEAEKPDYFRALCNVRPPYPVSDKFLRLQDEYLSEKNARRGTVSADTFSFSNRISLWRGDITRLAADAIVNACNCTLLGCFQPLHGCIDNVIHSAAGVQLRLDCQKIMNGKEEKNGGVRVTRGYNLPCRYVFHTVGPVVEGRVTEENRRDLKNCYLSCLDKAEALRLNSIAFCCISTGVYRFPKEEACAIAVHTVRNWLTRHAGNLCVVFDVFSKEDEEIYARELSAEN